MRISDWSSDVCSSDLTRIAIVLSTLAFAGFSFAQNISIGTGGTGGVYYPMGGGLAAVLSKYVPGMQATAEVTGGSVDNLKLNGTEKPYIGLTSSEERRVGKARASTCKYRGSPT